MKQDECDRPTRQLSAFSSKVDAAALLTYVLVQMLMKQDEDGRQEWRLFAFPFFCLAGPSKSKGCMHC